MKNYFSFHWNEKRLGVTQEELEKIKEILDTLTEEQVKAVEIYGRSQYEEGFDAGADNFS